MDSENIEIWYNYIIYSNEKNLSYNGSTNNIKRRLRQHNGEITGGAFRTHQGRPWTYCAVLRGMPNQRNALSCEWRIRYPNNRRNKEAKYRGIKGRIVGLNEVLQLDKWTNPCTDMNCDMQLDLFIHNDYLHLLEVEKIPSNIKIHSISELDF